MSESDDNYARWGPTNSGQPPTPAPIRYVPSLSELDSFGFISYLVVALALGAKLYAVLDGLPSVFVWLIEVLAGLLLLWVWPAIYAVAIFLVCAGVVGYCALQIFRAFVG